MAHTSPLAVVQAQLDAYNAKDVDALLMTYAADAEQYEMHGPLLAKGHAQMRDRFLTRFTEPDLHARLLSRTVVENTVVDHEVVTRNLPEGKAAVELLCVYQVEGGRIRKASFATGKTTMLG